MATGQAEGAARSPKPEAGLGGGWVNSSECRILPLQPRGARAEEGAGDTETPEQIPQPLSASAGRAPGPGGSQPFWGLNPHPHLLGFAVNPKLTYNHLFLPDLLFLPHPYSPLGGSAQLLPKPLNLLTLRRVKV